MNPKKLLIITCILGILVSIIFYLFSPEEVATHFDAKGFPDSWASRQVNLSMWIALYIIMMGFYLSLPLIFKKISVKFINIPNKQYWLAPERIDYTITTISNLLYYNGVAINLFILTLGILGFKANQLEEVRLNNTVVFILLGILLIYIIGWLIRFCRQFKRPG